MQAKLKDLVDIHIGLQIREGLEIRPDGTHLLIQAKDIDEDDGHQLKISEASRFFPTRDVTGYVIRSRDLLFLARGRRTYAAVVDALEPGTPPAVALYYFFILRLKVSFVTPAFLAWVINESELQEHLAKAARGTTIPFIPKKVVTELEIGIPSLDTQNLITTAHNLAVRERSIARALESKRFDLTQITCRKAYRREAF